VQNKEGSLGRESRLIKWSIGFDFTARCQRRAFLSRVTHVAVGKCQATWQEYSEASTHHSILFCTAAQRIYWKRKMSAEELVRIDTQRGRSGGGPRSGGWREPS